MTRSREEVFLYSLSAYTAVSLFVTLLVLLASLAFMRLAFAAARAALGPEHVYWLKPALYDSCGFAAAAALTALAQYFSASLFRLCGAGRGALAGSVFFVSVFCGLFFWRCALYSTLGDYGFSGLCVTIGAMIGGFQAAFQDPALNPWPASARSFFN